MASCITTGVNSTCPQVKLEVTQTASTNTNVTLSWTLSFVTHGYTFSSSASKTYTATINGTQVASGSFAIGGKTTQTLKSGTVTINKTRSTQSIAFSCGMDFTTAKWSGTELGNRTASGSISVAAKPSYTVSYNANGGSGQPGNQTKWYGETLTLSSTKPSRTGYSFKNWNTTSNGSGTSYASGASYTANSGATLYAQWTINTYTISYNANGGSGAPGNQTKTHGTNLTLSSTKPTRTGYTFLGWSTSSSATSATYAAGATYTANSGATLYAVWRINTFTVSYNANGGANAPSAQTKTYGVNLTLTSGKPTRTGYTFKNWNTAANGSGTSYESGASYTANSGITLYAQWNANPYTISYDANGGTGAPGNQTKYHDQTLVLSSAEPTRAYYNFLGWGTSASSTTVAYNPGSNYTNNSAITLYAIWEVAYIKPKIKEFNITRCTSDGTVSDEGECALITCTWEIDAIATAQEAKIEWKYPDQSSYDNSEIIALTDTSGSFSQIVGNDTLSIEDTFNFRITIIDSLGSTSTSRDLPPMIFTVDFLAGGNGMAVGRPAKMSNTLDIGWRARMLNGSYVFVSTGTQGANGYIKLATIKIINHWINIPIELVISQRGTSAFSTLAINFENVDNKDPGIETFLYSANYALEAYLVRSDTSTWDLYIKKTESWDSIAVVDFKCDFEYLEPRAIFNWVSSEQVDDINSVITDTTYVKASHETNKILGYGAYYMGDGQTITLTEKVSNQQNGIVLVFSRYDDSAGEPLNEHFCYHFVPKIIVSLQPGRGSVFTMSTSNETFAASKYLYITDTEIRGHANNMASGTGNTGVAYNNKKFVLRYVVGV